MYVHMYIHVYQFPETPNEACRTQYAKKADDILTKTYQIGTKVGRFFLSRGGEHGKCVICTLNLV